MTVNDLNMATRMTAQNVMTKVLLKKFLREIQTDKLRISDQILVKLRDHQFGGEGRVEGRDVKF